MCVTFLTWLSIAHVIILRKGLTYRIIFLAEVKAQVVLVSKYSKGVSETLSYCEIWTLSATPTFIMNTNAPRKTDVPFTLCYLIILSSLPIDWLVGFIFIFNFLVCCNHALVPWSVAPNIGSFFWSIGCLDLIIGWL